MMNDFLFLSDIAVAGVRTMVCLFLISRLLSVKKPDKKGAAAALAGVAVIVGMIHMADASDFYRMILEIAFIAGCAVCFQGAKIRMSLFTAVFYEIAVSFWQFLFASWLGVLFDAPSFCSDKTVQGQIAVWCLHLLLAALAGYALKRADMTGKEGFAFASAISVAGFLAVVTLSEQKVLAIDDDMLNMWTILAVVLMMSVLVFNMNRQYEVEKELAEVKSEQAKLLERDYTALNNAYAVNAKLFHDLHNHIGVLHRLLSHNKTEEAMQYLNELQAPVREMADTVWTGDETADYLINSKAAEAKKNGIQYQVQVEFPRHTNIKSADLCAVLGNLLDNALEAARQVQKQEQRFIRLTIRRIHQMLVIKVENSFQTQPVNRDGSLQTAKEENGLHGWGLKSAGAAAEKYDGMVQTSYTDNIFTAVAVLSYQGVSVLRNNSAKD